MFQGPFEWGVAGAMTAVVATIGGWYAVDWGRARVAETSVEPVRHVLPAAKELNPATSLVIDAVRPRPAAVSPKVRVVASRGDSWLQVRAESPKGRVLYDGTLARGDDLTFGLRPLWIRFGAASNVDLRVAGRTARLPLFGTFDAYVSRKGARPDPVFHPDSPSAGARQATAAQSP